MFNYDGPVMQIINKIVDVFVLGVIWLIMCIPIFTIGASTTAAYYVAFSLTDDKDGYVIKKFFKSFKMNFVQSTILFFIMSIVSAFAVLNLKIVFVGMNGIQDFVRIGAMISQLFLIYETAICSYFGFALLSKIEFTNKNLFKAAFFLGNRYVLTALLNLCVIIAIVFAVLSFPLLILFSGGAYFVLSAILMRRVIVKFKPEAFDSDVVNDDNTFSVDTEFTKKFTEADVLELSEKEVSVGNLEDK